MWKHSIAAVGTSAALAGSDAGTIGLARAEAMTRAGIPGLEWTVAVAHMAGGYGVASEAWSSRTWLQST